MEYLALMPIVFAALVVTVLAYAATVVWLDVWREHIKPYLPETKRAYIKRKLKEYKVNL